MFLCFLQRDERCSLTPGFSQPKVLLVLVWALGYEALIFPREPFHISMTILGFLNCPGSYRALEQLMPSPEKYFERRHEEVSASPRDPHHSSMPISCKAILSKPLLPAQSTHYFHISPKITTGLLLPYPGSTMPLGSKQF